MGAVCGLIPAVLRQDGVPSARDEGEEPTVVWAAWSGTGSAVVKVQVGAAEAAMIVKVFPRQTVPGGDRSAERLRDLRADPRLGDFVPLIPIPLGHGRISGRAYSVELALPGIGANVVLARPGAREMILPAAAAAIGQLHQSTRRTIMVDAATRYEWIDRPAQVVARVAGHREMASLADQLGREWEGRRVVVSWIHGDFWPGNLLVTPDATAVTGIVDWKWAAPDGWPHHDLLHLLVYTRMRSQGVEMGTVVRVLLDGASWDPTEQRILDDAPTAGDATPLDARAMLLLFWLRHVSLTLAHSPHFARNWIWMARNVHGVLAGLERSA